MKFLAFIGAAVIMGIIIDFIIRNKKYNQEIERLEAKVVDLEKSVDILSEKAQNICKISENKIEEIKKNSIDLTGIADYITQQSEVVLAAYDSIMSKIDILADLSDDKGLTDIERSQKNKEYIALIAKDFELCQEHERLINQFTMEFGHER